MNPNLFKMNTSLLNLIEARLLLGSIITMTTRKKKLMKLLRN